MTVESVTLEHNGHGCIQVCAWACAKPLLQGAPLLVADPSPACKVLIMELFLQSSVQPSLIGKFGHLHDPAGSSQAILRAHVFFCLPAGADTQTAASCVQEAFCLQHN